MRQKILALFPTRSGAGLGLHEMDWSKFAVKQTGLLVLPFITEKQVVQKGG